LGLRIQRPQLTIRLNNIGLSNHLDKPIYDITIIAF
jgi:hypothetical protein